MNYSCYRYIICLHRILLSISLIIDSGFMKYLRIVFVRRYIIYLPRAFIQLGELRSMEWQFSLRMCLFSGPSSGIYSWKYGQMYIQCLLIPLCQFRRVFIFFIKNCARSHFAPCIFYPFGAICKNHYDRR